MPAQSRGREGIHRVLHPLRRDLVAGRMRLRDFKSKKSTY